jgi:hypothetical protein
MELVRGICIGYSRYMSKRRVRESRLSTCDFFGEHSSASAELRGRMAHSGRVALLSVCFIAIITGSLAQCVNGISAHLFEDRIPSRSSRGLSDQFQQCRTVYRYQTSKNGSDRITQKPSIRFGPTTLPALANITVDVSTTYQEILGTAHYE